MGIEITEEEINAELKKIRAGYLTAVNLLSEDELRGAAIHRLYYRHLVEIQKERDFQLYGISVDTSTKSE